MSCEGFPALFTARGNQSNGRGRARRYRPSRHDLRSAYLWRRLARRRTGTGPDLDPSQGWPGRRTIGYSAFGVCVAMFLLLAHGKTISTKASHLRLWGVLFALIVGFLGSADTALACPGERDPVVQTTSTWTRPPNLLRDGSWGRVAPQVVPRLAIAQECSSDCCRDGGCSQGKKHSDCGSSAANCCCVGLSAAMTTSEALPNRTPADRHAPHPDVTAVTTASPPLFKPPRSS